MSEDFKNDAEGLFRSGKYNCAEAVFETARKSYFNEIPETVTRSFAGFAGGSGTGCICGALVGATSAIGIKTTNKKDAAKLTKELHHWFKSIYGASCCRLIRENHGRACQELVGVVAEKTAEMIKDL